MRMGIQTVRPFALAAIIFTVLLTGGVWSPCMATAATYYVALTGNDANPGTQAQPFQTIAKGISVLKAGDTLYLRGGTYSESINTNNYTIPSGTSWSNPVTIAGSPGETVTLPTINVASASVQYVVFKDFSVTGAPGAVSVTNDAGNSTPGDSFVRFQKLDVHDWSNATNDATNGFIIFANHVEILNSKIHHSPPSNYAPAYGGILNPHGIYVVGAFNLIDSNEIYNNYGYGIHLFANAGYGGQFVHDNIIRNNKVYNNGIPPGNAGGGMILSSGDNNLAYNNLVYNQGNGTNGIDISYGANNTQVFNNTVYGNAGYGISIFNDRGGVNNTLVRNNIIYGNGGLAIYNATSNAIIDHNLTTNPGFVNAGSADFHLQATSPAINAGMTINVVTVDLQGSPRPQGAGYDIGAYEYQASQPSQFPTPKNLRTISVAP